MFWQFKKHFNTHYFIWPIKELYVNYHFHFIDKEIDFRENTLVNIAKNLIGLFFLWLLSISFYDIAARVAFLLLKILWRLPILYIFVSTCGDLWALYSCSYPCSTPGFGNVFCKVPGSKYFRCQWDIHVPELCSCSHRQYVNELAWLCSSKTLFIRTAGQFANPWLYNTIP